MRMLNASMIFNGFKSNKGKIIVFFVFLLFLSITASILINSNELSIAYDGKKAIGNINNTGFQDEGVDVSLEYGADADWAGSGFDLINGDGTSPVASVLLRGAEDRPLTINVQVWARLGSLTKEIIDTDVDLAEKEEAVVSIDLRNALGIHERQNTWATRIRAAVAVVYKDGSKGMNMSLEPRYLVVNDSSLEVLDKRNLEEKYPYGATTVEEQEKLKKIVETFPPEEQPYVSFGPGIHAEKPLSETGFPDDRQ